jgi:hypothetical protein
MKACAVIKLVPLWIILAILVAAIASGRNFIRYRQLTDGGIAIAGTVTQLEPANHRFVHYSYLVSGRSFSGRGRAGFGNPEFEDLRVGDVVSVSYLPENEDLSCLGDPHELLRRTERFMLSTAVVFPTLVLLAFYWRYPGFRTWLAR